MSIAIHILKKYYGISEKINGLNSPTILGWIRKFFPKVNDTSAIPWCSIGMIEVCRELSIDCSKQTPMAISWTGWGRSIKLANINPEKNQIIVLKRVGGNHVGTPIRYAPSKNLVYVLGFNQSDAANIQAFKLGDVLEVREV